MQFNVKNIKPQWMDLVNEFSEFILDPSPEVISWYESHKDSPYNDVPKDKSELCNLRYGFEHDLGWKSILREHFNGIKDLIEQAKANGDEIFYKTCILKEKFGSLRDQGDFYGKDKRSYWDEYSALVSSLHEKSEKICEVCGYPATLRRKMQGMGWIKTLCDTHAKLSNYNH